MHRKSRTIGLFGMSVLLLLPQLALSDGGSLYRVTISNLTAGQPFTPPVLATHNKKTGIFTLGEETSAALQQIAENGDNGPLVNLLSGDANVRAVVSGMLPPIVPANDPGGQMFSSSKTLEIWAGGNAKYLSIVSMLICTNDGFMGIDSVRLPSKKRTVFAVAYDARTEQNTEDFADMVPPCQPLTGVTPGDAGTGTTNPMLSENGVVIPHAGINGVADINGVVDLLPQVYGWGDPVAKIVIERIGHNDHDDDSDSDSDSDSD